MQQQRSIANRTVKAAYICECDDRDTSDVIQEATFARLARQLRSATSAFQNKLEQKPKQARKLVVGASVENKRVKAVTTTRTVDIFVSRLHPETHVNELDDCYGISGISGLRGLS